MPDFQFEAATYSFGSTQGWAQTQNLTDAFWRKFAIVIAIKLTEIEILRVFRAI